MNPVISATEREQGGKTTLQGLPITTEALSYY